jgi:hypothetical protein
MSIELPFPDISTDGHPPPVRQWGMSISRRDEEKIGVDLDVLSNLFNTRVTPDWLYGYVFASHLLGGGQREICSFHMDTDQGFIDGFRQFRTEKEVVWEMHGHAAGANDQAPIDGGASVPSNVLYWYNKYELKGFDFVWNNAGPIGLLMAACLKRDGIFVQKTSDPCVAAMVAFMFDRAYAWGNYVIGQGRAVLTPSHVRKLRQGMLPPVDLEWQKKYEAARRRKFEWPIDQIIDSA